MTCTCVPFGVVSQVISKADFIATVVNFDTDSLTNAVIKTVEDVFKAAGDLSADAVTRASKACGPLYNVRSPLAVRGDMTFLWLSWRRDGNGGSGVG